VLIAWPGAAPSPSATVSEIDKAQAYLRGPGIFLGDHFIPKIAASAELDPTIESNQSVALIILGSSG